MLEGIYTVKNWVIKQVEVPLSYIEKYPRGANIFFNAAPALMNAQAVWVVGQLYLSGNPKFIAQIGGVNIPLSNLSSVWLTGLISDLLIHGGQMLVTEESNSYITLALAIASFIRGVSTFSSLWKDNSHLSATKDVLTILTHTQNVVYDLKTLVIGRNTGGEGIEEEQLL